MGKLAMWGAVAGGAEGMQENIKHSREVKAADIDSQRETALERLKHTNAMELEGLRQDSATGRTQIQSDTQMGVQELRGDQEQDAIKLRDVYAKENQEDEQSFKAGESALERESDERIAKYSKGSGATAALTRFQAKTLKVGEPVLGNDGQPIPGFTIETDTPGIYDSHKGGWYLQSGNKLIFPGDKISAAKRAPQSALDALYAEPARMSVFYGYYNYLPLELLGVLNEAAISQYGASMAPPPQAQPPQAQPPQAQPPQAQPPQAQPPQPQPQPQQDMPPGFQ